MRAGAAATRARSRAGHLALAAAALASVASFARPAQAVPVAYTAGGVLGAGTAGDAIHLNGSTLRITLFADTTDAPASTSSGTGSTQARFHPSSGFLEFTNRPGGFPDLKIAYTPDLVTANEFAPSVAPDAFAIAPGSTQGVTGSSFLVPGFEVAFLGGSFFPGTGAAPLPLFTAADLAPGVSLDGVLTDVPRASTYPLTGAFLGVSIVPEPAPAFLLALGLAVLAARRHG
jgi:hypothetical protein